MDLNQIKDILEKEGGKIIIVEHDKPQMVVMSFAEWRKKPKQEQEQEVSPAPLPVEEGNLEGITIDDLPL